MLLSKVLASTVSSELESEAHPNVGVLLSRAAGSKSAGSVPAAEAVYRDTGC